MVTTLKENKDKKSTLVAQCICYMHGKKLQDKVFFKFKYFSAKLPQKLHYFRWSCFSHCCILSTALLCLYQVGLMLLFWVITKRFQSLNHLFGGLKLWSLKNVVRILALSIRELCLWGRLFIIIASLHPGVQIVTSESWGVTCDELASCHWGIEIILPVV